MDAVLVNRLPNVELLTRGELDRDRGLVVTAGLTDFVRFPIDAANAVAAYLVGEADAAVVVWAERDPDVRLLLALVERKSGYRSSSSAGSKKPRARRRSEPEGRRTRGLPV